MPSKRYRQQCIRSHKEDTPEYTLTSCAAEPSQQLSSASVVGVRGGVCWCGQERKGKYWTGTTVLCLHGYGIGATPHGVCTTISKPHRPPHRHRDRTPEGPTTLTSERVSFLLFNVSFKRAGVFWWAYVPARNLTTTHTFTQQRRRWLEFSGLANVKEVLKYLRHVVKTACSYMAASTGERTWLNVRDRIKRTKLYSTTVQWPVARYALCYEN